MRQQMSAKFEILVETAGYRAGYRYRNGRIPGRIPIPKRPDTGPDTDTETAGYRAGYQYRNGRIPGRIPIPKRPDTGPDTDTETAGYLHFLPCANSKNVAASTRILNFVDLYSSILSYSVAV